MTTARSEQIDLNSTPYYHCISRCVRRSYLCGKHEITGQDYSHRKTWLVKRIKWLASIFAIKICAYAVMSNHYHLVLFIDDTQARGWNKDEIRARWSKIFPNDAEQYDEFPKKVQEEKLKLWQERLMSISWYMRCMNETIAKQSNKEDNCKGRFWEGRFKSQALLDEGALLSAMAYVDLNPIRAKIAKTPEESEFTSIYERIQTVSKQLKNHTQANKSKVQFSKHCDKAKQPFSLMAFDNQGLLKENTINFKLSEYLELVDFTGRIFREDKRGVIPENLMPILSRLNLRAEGWMSLMKGLESDFSYAVGNSDVLIEFGGNEHGPKGMSAARHCYIRAAYCHIF